MNFCFSKYSGTGNDFVLIDNRTPFFSQKWVPSICNRRNGVGADGVILLEKGAKTPFKMRIFNSDGSEAEMCGNGLRCLTKFLVELGIDQNTFEIENFEGKIFETRLRDENVSIKMIPPHDLKWHITVEGKIGHFMNTGVPHFVLFSKNIETIDVKKEGAYLRNHPQFQPKGTNVNFATILDDKTLSLRTFERGVEDETLACGTGSVAAALAASQIHDLSSPIRVKARSGAFLKIDFKKDKETFFDVFLEGEAKQIFNGSYTKGKN